jgi:aryl-alcohol dehydrogenase
MIATAAVTESKCAPFVLQEVEVGELRPDEVLVKVAASGICHTDLICRDQWYPVPFPWRYAGSPDRQLRQQPQEWRMS